MTNPIPRRRFVALACAMLALALSSLPSALAQDKGKDKDGQKNGKKEKPDPKDTAEWKECARIGASFQAKDSAALVARMQPKGKLRLALGATSGDFEKSSAGPNLDKWFEGKTEIDVEMKKINGLTGTLTLTFKTKGKDKKTSLDLIVTLEKKVKGDGFFLTKLETV